MIKLAPLILGKDLTVTCIKTAQGRITHVGGKARFGIPWSYSVETAIMHFRNKSHQFFTIASNGETTAIGVDSAKRPYLSTNPNDNLEDNLGELDKCR